MNTDTHKSIQALDALNYFAVLEAIADKTSTGYGHDLILNLLPNLSLKRINEDFDRIEEIEQLIQKQNPLPFGGTRDIRQSLAKSAVAGTYVEADKLLDVAGTLVALRKLDKHIQFNKVELESLIPITQQIVLLENLERDIYAKIDANEAEVKDSASPELRRIRSKIQSNANKTRNKLNSLLAKYHGDNYLLETGYTLREGRYVLAVLQQHKNRVHGIVHDVSGSGGTVYIEPSDLVELGNEMRHLIEEESEEVRRILMWLTDRVREHKYEIEAGLEALGILDSLQARAYFANQYGAMRPTIGTEHLRLVQARHPLLLIRKGLDAVVPLDLELDTDNRSLVITGPNAGGKTVALKTAGLISVMVHSGIIPPCGDDTAIPEIDSWHVVIGDDQSLEGDLSSFSGHLEKLKNILDDTSYKKLVLVDEIAAGTDPTEGSALAMAILEKAINEKWWTIITTHMGELKAFAHRREGLRNGSMQFDQELLTPTYRFQPDIPGSSYALEIASRVGISSDVVNRAREILGEERLHLEDLIEELSSKLTLIDRERRQMAIQESKIAGLESVLNQRLEKIQAQKDKLAGEAADQAEALLREANKTLEKAVKEIRESQASKEAIKAARALVETQKQNVQETKDKIVERNRRKKTTAVQAKPESKKKTKAQAAIPQEPEDFGPVKVGDSVRMPNGMTGEILAIQNKKAQVAAGSLKIWMKLDELSKIRPARAKSGGVKIHVGATDDGPVSAEIHLRGMRYEEAEGMLEKYLEDVTIAGLPFARIVHGKGTGALMSMVRRKLNNHPSVKSYRLGGEQEGGDGVTIVNIK